jgi:Short C-terminal domain
MGLLGGMARTAVVAGTATAVSGRVQRRQAARFSDSDAHLAAQRQQAYEAEVGAPQAAYPPAAPVSDPDDKLEQLSKLGELKAQGILTEEEFATEKAKILSS